MPDCKELVTLIRDLIYLTELSVKICCTICFCVVWLLPVRVQLKANIFVRATLVLGAWGYVLTILYNNNKSIVCWAITLLFAFWFFCQLDWEEYFGGRNDGPRH